MNQPQVKLSCQDVWKIFGKDAESFLKNADHKPGFGELSEAGLIGAVRQANFEIMQGEIFVIMGLSGSGKSTLVRCMTRLIEPTAGHVLFDGEDLLAMSEKELIDVRRHRMGMVFQHFALLPHLDVLGNVTFPLEVQGVPRKQREQRAAEVIELVGLSGRESYYPRELSGGQQQRVGIARSLAVEPEIWFLDEPFSALDPLIRREMQDEFLRIQQLLNKTIVFITHDFDEAIRLADRIVIMKDGEIVQIGTPEELILNPATDYVLEFTKNINRSKVLTVHSLMSEDMPTDDADNTVDVNDKVELIAHSVITATAPTAVTRDGVVVGSLHAKAVLDVIAPVSTQAE